MVGTCFHLAHKGPPSPHRLLSSWRETSPRLFMLLTHKSLSSPHELSPGPKDHCTHMGVRYFRLKRPFNPAQALIFLPPKDIVPTWAFNTSGPQRPCPPTKDFVFVAQNNIMLEYLLSYSHSYLDYQSKKKKNDYALEFLMSLHWSWVIFDIKNFLKEEKLLMMI